MPIIKSLKIQGYRPFRDFSANLTPLELLVGANGTGKTALFEFLKFLRDSTYQEIPPEIVAGAIGQEIFHRPGEARFWWSLEIDMDQTYPIRYQGQVNGPIGQTQVTFERVITAPDDDKPPLMFMDMKDREGVIRNQIDGKLKRKDDLLLQRTNQLALSVMTNPAFKTLYELRNYVLSWRFYSAFRINQEKLRRPVVVEQDPVLHEDCGNLSVVLFYLQSEHRHLFDKLQDYLKMMIPGFVGLTIKSRGGPGQMLAFWQERGINADLSLADVSDGILRLLCWATLAVLPNPPRLICIDEPEQGVHPRALFVLADLFQALSERTQVLLATHNSYFLTLFPLETVAILRKEDGQSIFRKPIDSAMINGLLEDFGPEALPQLHHSDQLEDFS